MPLPDGSLTPEEFDLIRRKLAQMYSRSPSKERPPCPSCGSVGFYIHPALLANRSDSLISAHTRTPTVGTYCKTCGHLTEYVAWVLGIEPLKVSTDGGESAGGH
jgi:hypothetical protein